MSSLYVWSSRFFFLSGVFCSSVAVYCLCIVILFQHSQPLFLSASLPPSISSFPFLSPSSLLPSLPLSFLPSLSLSHFFPFFFLISRFTLVTLPQSIVTGSVSHRHFLIEVAAATTFLLLPSQELQWFNSSRPNPITFNNFRWFSFTFPKINLCSTLLFLFGVLISCFFSFFHFY